MWALVHDLAAPFSNQFPSNGLEKALEDDRSCEALLSPRDTQARPVRPALSIGVLESKETPRTMSDAIPVHSVGLSSLCMEVPITEKKRLS